MLHTGITLIIQIVQFGELKWIIPSRSNSRVLWFPEQEMLKLYGFIFNWPFMTSGIDLKYVKRGEFHLNNACFSFKCHSLKQPSLEQQPFGVQLFTIDPSVFSDALARNVMLFHYWVRSDKLGLLPQGTGHSLTDRGIVCNHNWMA